MDESEQKRRSIELQVSVDVSELPPLQSVVSHASNMHERQPSDQACLQEELSSEDRPQPHLGKLAVSRFLDSVWVTAFMLLLTFYALFGDDIRGSCFSIKADDVFYGMTATCFALFSLELILASWAKADYRWSFFFYLDLISTISLLPDIGWLWEGIMDNQTTAVVGQAQTAGVTSRAGARSARIIRVIRVIRVVRLSKIYKNASKIKNHNQVAPSDEYSIPDESKIGKKLTDLTIKRVIVLVLGLLVLLPLFDVEFFTSTYTGWEYGTHDLQRALQGPDFLSARAQFISYYVDSLRPLIYLRATVQGRETIWHSEVGLDDLRTGEKYTAQTDHIKAVFDLRADTVFASQLSICQTLFICLVLTLGAVSLSQDSNRLVIIPIEKMIDKVKRMARNPLAAMNDDMRDVFDLETPSKSCWCCSQPPVPQGLETSLLEDAIMKIGALLALGFGEAGAQIITDNLGKQSSTRSVLGEGSKVLAIFSLCDIRNFTDTTEVLQERVMVFVNEIAAVVHHTVDEFLGAANKNIGDAFLLVWKFTHEHTEVRNQKLYLTKTPYVSAYADLALLAVLKIIAKINSSTTILKYRDFTDLKKRMPGYSVKLGFGLHLGWAVEGAIGSEFKVDASYLSPHVNLTAKLEELTKVYGVPLVLSNAVHKVLGSFVRKHCRHIDTVKLPAAHKAFALYTYDVTFARLFPTGQKPFDKETSKNKRRDKITKLEEGRLDSSDLIYKSKKLKYLSENLLPGYLDAFERGVTEYEAGHWTSSRELLEQSLEFKPADGPSQALLTYMRDYDFTAPSDWPGYRVLFGH